MRQDPEGHPSFSEHPGIFPACKGRAEDPGEGFGNRLRLSEFQFPQESQEPPLRRKRSQLSWIIKDLWKALEERQVEYEALLSHGKPLAFETINKVAFEVGERHGVFLQVNFPPGRSLANTKDVDRSEE